MLKRIKMLTSLKESIFIKSKKSKKHQHTKWRVEAPGPET